MKVITYNDLVNTICDKTETKFEKEYDSDILICYLNDEVVNRFRLKTCEGLVINEVEKVPEEVVNNQMAWCYTKEKGFYLNPDWREPKPYTDEQYDAVVLELVKEGRL